MLSVDRLRWCCVDCAWCVLSVDRLCWCCVDCTWCVLSVDRLCWCCVDCAWCVLSVDRLCWCCVDCVWCVLQAKQEQCGNTANIHFIPVSESFTRMDLISLLIETGLSSFAPSRLHHGIAQKLFSLLEYSFQEVIDIFCGVYTCKRVLHGDVVGISTGD